MSYTTDLIKNRRQAIDTGSSGGNNASGGVRTQSNSYTSQILERRRSLINSNQGGGTQVLPPLISKPQVQEQPERKGVLKTASDFIGIGTGELKNAWDSGIQKAQSFFQDIGYRDQQNTLKSDVKSGIKRTYDSAKEAIVSNIKERENEEAKFFKEKYGEDVDYSKLTYEQIRDFSSTKFLNKAKEDFEIDLQKLEAKKNKSKTDLYRIKNTKDTLREIEETLALSPEEKAKKDVFITGLALARGSSDIGTGFLGVAESVADFFKWRSDVAGLEKVSEFSEKAGDRMEAWASEVRVNNPDLADKILEGVGSTIPFLVINGGVTSLAGRLTSISPKLAQTIGVSASAFTEAGIEAGSVYQENIDRGMSQEEADLRASRVFAGNIVFNYVTDKYGLFNDAEGVKKYLISGMGEGTQESWQNALSNVATDKPIGENAGETFMVAFLSGSTLIGANDIVTGAGGQLNQHDIQILQKFQEDINSQKEAGAGTDQKDQAETKTLTQEISEQATNSLENKDVGQKEGSIDTIKEAIQAGEKIDPVEIRRTDEGDIVIVDGRHRLEASRQTNTPIEFVDVTNQFNKEYTGDLVQELQDQLIQNQQKTDIKESQTQGETQPTDITSDQKVEEAKIKDLNRPFNEEVTKQVIDDTISGVREDFRLDKTENIQKYSQGFGDAKPTDTVIVYRAGTGEIKPGEFVTTSQERAEQVYMPERAGAELLSKEVAIQDLVHGNGLKSEFVYSPKGEESVQDATKTQGADKEISDKKKVDESKSETKPTKKKKKQEVADKAKVEEKAKGDTRLSDYYSEQDQEAVGQAWYEVMSELEVAEAGSRIYDENGNVVGGISSTFPDWVPSELRIKSLFESVLKEVSDPTNMTFPPNSQPRKQALYEEILSMIDSRAGTDSSDIIEEIKNGKTQKETKQDTGSQEKTEADQATKTPSKRTKGSKEVSSVESGLQTKGAEKIDNFELRKPPKKNSDEFKLYKKIENLIRKYASTVGEGYTPRGALGVYFDKTKNIRVNSMNDLSVASHEIAHYLDFANKITENLQPKTKVTKELADIYVEHYPGAKPSHKDRLKMLEGYATLLQKYTEMPTAIEAKYPNLVKEMLKPGGKYYHPVIGDILTDLNEIVADYQKLSSLDKIGAKITSENANIDKGSFLNFWQKLRTQLADRVYPVEVLAEKTGRVGTKTDPSLWVRAYSSVSGIVNNNISTDRGYWAFTNLQEGFQKKYDYNWKTLVESVTNRGAIDDFASYLVARREHFYYQELDTLAGELENAKRIYEEVKGIKSAKFREEESYRNEYRDIISELDGFGIDMETDPDVIKASMKKALEIAENKHDDLKKILDNDGFSREEVDQAYEENKDLFKDEEEMFDTLSNEDLNMLHNEDVQLIDKKTFNRLKNKDGYASFKRQFYDEIVGDAETAGQIGVGGVKVSSLISRKGSSRTIINPLYSALANHSEVTRKAMKQIVYNQMGSLGKSGLLPTLFQEVQLKAVPDGQGRIIFPQEKDSNIIMARENYKRKPILTDKTVKQTIDNLLTYKNIDVFTQLYTGLTRTFTAGTTGLYPAFALTNFVVDQITATANSYNKYKALYSPMKEMLNVMRNKNSVEAKYYEEYLVMGGERQTFTGWQKVQPKDLFRKIAGEKKNMQKAIDALNKGVDILSIPSAKSEIFSRATEYINARKAGKSQIVALEEAGRVTAPFHHIGAWGGDFFSTYIRGLPFFNASVQVLDQTLRVGATKSGRQRMAFVTMAVTSAYLTAILAMLDASDEQKEQYRDLEPEDLTNFVYFPNPNGKDLIRIKMSNTFSVPGATMNMIIANKMFSANYTVRDVAESATAFLPTQFQILEPKNILSWLPQVFKPTAYTILNVKDYPKVTALVPSSLTNLPERYQYNEGTSTFAKKMGELLNVSPIKVDYLLTGYLGRASGFLTGKPGVYNPGNTIFRTHYFTMGRNVRQYYELKDENDGEYSAYQNWKPGTEEYDRDRVREIYRVKIITEDMNDVLTEYRKIDPEKDIEKASELRTKFFFLKEKLDDGTVPKNYSSWAKDADKRRRKNKNK